MALSLSRRHFLHAAGAGAASVWVPKPIKGYTGAEIQQQVVDNRLEVGISKWDLDGNGTIDDMFSQTIPLPFCY